MQGSGSGSITGGYVYRGSAIPGLHGAYLYADEITSSFAALRYCAGTAVTPMSLAGLDHGVCQNPVTFGEDRASELLVPCLNGSSQAIYRIVSP